MEVIKDQLLVARVIRGLNTQSAASRESGIPQSYFSFAERGLYDHVPKRMKIKMAEFYGIDPVKLWGNMLLTPTQRSLAEMIYEDSEKDDA